MKIAILPGDGIGHEIIAEAVKVLQALPLVESGAAERFGLSDLSEAAMAPWFEQVERRLNIHEWEAEPNANNAALRQGALKLGIEAPTIRRNVRGCWNLGSCGMGCPTNDG